MKAHLAAIGITVALFISGCATLIETDTSFVPWHGNSVFKGNGGSVEKINGVEFWSIGAPEEQYRVIGIIKQKRYDSTIDNFLFGSYNQKIITDIVKKENGDGVVTLKSDQFGDPSTATLMNSSVLVVFRYEGR